MGHRVMSKARNIKSPDHYYFDIDVIKELTPDGEPFSELIEHYAKYVLYRAKVFSGRFRSTQIQYLVTHVYHSLMNCMTALAGSRS